MYLTRTVPSNIQISWLQITTVHSKKVRDSGDQRVNSGHCCLTRQKQKTSQAPCSLARDVASLVSLAAHGLVVSVSQQRVTHWCYLSTAPFLWGMGTSILLVDSGVSLCDTLRLGSLGTGLFANIHTKSVFGSTVLLLKCWVWRSSSSSHMGPLLRSWLQHGILSSEARDQISFIPWPLGLEDGEKQLQHLHSSTWVHSNSMPQGETSSTSLSSLLSNMIREILFSLDSRPILVSFPRVTGGYSTLCLGLQPPTHSHKNKVVQLLTFTVSCVLFPRYLLNPHLSPE